MRCSACGNRDTIEKLTLQPKYVTYEEVRGIAYNPITGRWILDIEEILPPQSPEVKYQCSYCWKEYTEKEIINGYSEG